MMHKSYSVQLEKFQGPMDLLLYFIRRDELDIYDIPIGEITKEFIETIEMWKRMNMGVAGDFIVMASTLMRVKAKMLIPRKEIDEDGLMIDPRRELMEQLIEYKRFKDVSGSLENLAENRSHHFPKGFEMALTISDKTDELGSLLKDVSLYDLAIVFKKVMENRPMITAFELHREPVKLEAQKELIFRHFDGDGKLKFSTLLKKLNTRMEIVVTFLAILDLVRLGDIRITQDETFGDLLLMHIGAVA
ncbi:MAG: segregation/condensation protein A [Candidatus Marinimicrobia bacterium]|jgi:segregation and condensation protein A|nr:segregation/condensation protein A [Candidatus Neomarinimicrobiota bacterium]MBT3496361.1 segregation/condensation protein A [Candidatus Neomarinimicrobiota bacterium]MBT3692572.1 segregation/condensation protein A [Candidatus Neomarinimicrobiota bacterium]MBT3731991.1 segregation/condensation protein A [Candidatus Neomarinimicrobiota bacterium]MBT4145210.1 segregation/condensation protein A [Candidatus Neomarinimicrobiota bacterium]